MGRGLRWGTRTRAAIGIVTIVTAGFVVAGATRAFAAETHTDCVTFDDNGNVIAATPQCSETVHSPSAASSFPAQDPCTGGYGLLTINDDHSVFHVNVNGAGDMWLTGTDGGSATFAAFDPTGPTGSGTWTSWFGGQMNNQAQVGGSTFTVRLNLSDGTHVTVHENTHATLTPGGVTISHDNRTMTCGG